MPAILLRRLWIGCCSVSMLLQTLLLLDRPLTGQGWLVGFVFGATIFGYQFFRTEPWQRVLAYAAGLGALLCLWWLPPFVAVQVAAPAGVWMLYYFAGERSLRRVQILKPVSIAFVWAWVTVLLPLPMMEWPAAVMIFFGRSLFIFALALAYDLSDLHHDRQHRFLTQVQYWGPRKTFQYIDTALLAAGLVCILNYWCKIYGAWAMSVLIGSLLFTAGALRVIHNQVRRHYWQKFWIDALMVLQFLGVAGGRFLDIGTLF